jgi:hypothetical protein
MSKPPVPIKNSGIKPNDSGPGVVCHGCKAAIPALTNLSQIPDPFRMKCPKCGRDDEYRRHEIRVLKAHRKQ